MKQRLLVMNGQRILQVEEGSSWRNEKVDKAGDIKPGIYSLYNAKQADRTKETIGVILHADKAGVYQSDGKSIVKHDRGAFDRAPDAGAQRGISYNPSGRAVVNIAIAQQSRTISR